MAGSDLSQADPSSRLAALALRMREDAGRLHERLRLSNAEGRAPARGLRRCWNACMAASAARSTLAAHWPTGTARQLPRRARPSPAARAGRGLPGGSRPAARRAGEPVPVCPLAARRSSHAGSPPGPRVGAIVAAGRSALDRAGFPEDAARRAFWRGRRRRSGAVSPLVGASWPRPSLSDSRLPRARLRYRARGAFRPGVRRSER